MTLNPPLPLAVTGVLLVLAAIALLRLGHAGTVALPSRARRGIAALRAGAFAALAVVLLDPGETVPLREERPSRWVVLADTSASMASRDDDAGPARSDIARDLTKKALGHARSAGVQTVLFAFDKTADLVTPEELARRPSDGPGTDPVAAAHEAVARAEAGGDVSGILLFSDARPTASTAPDELIARARAHGASVNTVLIGGLRETRNLVVHPARRNLSAFPGARVRLDFAVENLGLPAAGVPVSLRDATGKTLGETVVDAPAGGRARGAITFSAPTEPALLSLETPRRPGEAVVSDNARPVLVRPLPRRARTLLIEGAPSWDTKFLAQFLRGQPGFDVRAIHRIADDRVFESDTAHGLRTVPGFPADAESLAEYDLVILGKGVDALLGEPECRRLRSWVREHGGTLLLARGKPAPGDAPGELDSLSPIEWARGASGEVRMTPTREGESAGLFGGVLPGVADEVWTRLPALDQVGASGVRKPFARWLALASGPSGAAPTPVVATRRLESGAVAAVNAEGLWRWHLAPPAQRHGELYSDFWNQLLRVLADEAEFAPGRSLALTASAEVTALREPVTLTVSRRSTEGAAPARLLVTDPRGTVRTLGLSPARDAAGRAVLRAGFEALSPGAHLIRVADDAGRPLGAETCVEALPPPAESDNLSADPTLANALARATGGEVIAPADLDAWLARRMIPTPPVESATATRRMPAPFIPWIAAAGIALLGLEWFIRRRKGLS